MGRPPGHPVCRVAPAARSAQIFEAGSTSQRGSRWSATTPRGLETCSRPKRWPAQSSPTTHRSPHQPRWRSALGRGWCGGARHVAARWTRPREVAIRWARTLTGRWRGHVVGRRVACHREFEADVCEFRGHPPMWARSEVGCRERGFRRCSVGRCPSCSDCMPIMPRQFSPSSWRTAPTSLLQSPTAATTSMSNSRTDTAVCWLNKRPASALTTYSSPRTARCWVGST